jgi:hypothetical protein
MLRIKPNLAANTEVIYLTELDQSAHRAQTYAQDLRGVVGA